ncbi:hypothetical protein FQN57_004753 [Myotisia sp. PD_48]|nr:hypothetical protein FQN57_004753 [Myotisia sp. PD_48]
MVLDSNGKLDAVEGIIGYRFKERRLLQDALFAAISENSKRLALLGNAALRLVCIAEGYEASHNRGHINDILAEKWNKEGIAKRGFEKGLDSFVVTHASCQGKVPSGIMTTSVEAILGAVFYDSGRDIASVQNVMTVLGLELRN